MKILKNNIYLILSSLVLLTWTVIVISDNLSYATGSIIETFFQMLKSDIFYYYIPLAPIFVIFPAVLEYSKDFKSQNIKNKITRLPYKKYMKKLYLSTYKYGFVFLIPILIFGISSIVTENTINFSKNFSIDLGITMPANIYIIIYLILNYFYGVFFAKLSLIMVKKNRNIFISIILTFLIYFFIQIVGEIFIGDVLIWIIMGIHINNINSNFSIWTTMELFDLNMVIFLIFFIVLFIGIIIIEHIVYKNEEKVLIEIEKQD